MMQMRERDRNKIATSIRGKYRKVADSPAGLFNYPTGRAGLNGLDYDAALVAMLPDSVTDSFCGVGNPFSLATVPEGASILDVGCGTGVDTLLAALMAGPEGQVVGIDMVEKMLRRAQHNLARTPISNAHFLLSSAEDLPLGENRFEVVISNGVFNLVVDKGKALGEVFRVLRPGGQLLMADQVLARDAAETDRRLMVERWFR